MDSLKKFATMINLYGMIHFIGKNFLILRIRLINPIGITK